MLGNAIAAPVTENGSIVLAAATAATVGQKRPLLSPVDLAGVGAAGWAVPERGAVGLGEGSGRREPSREEVACMPRSFAGATMR